MGTHLEGRFRRPRRYQVIDQVIKDSSSARYHVALYKRRATAYVVVITEAGEATMPVYVDVDVDRGAGDDCVQTRTYRRLLGTAGFEVTVNRYLRFQDVLDLRRS